MYRVSRNVEASLIDFITEQLQADGWQGVRTEKVFANVYNGQFPCILVNIINVIPIRKEVGNYETLKRYLVAFRIFTEDDGQRLDLSDWLLEQLEPGIDYYTYTTKLAGKKKVVDSKTIAGRIDIRRFIENKKELENIQNLATEDKHRHLITVEMEVSFLPQDC